jgi:hypothetical protein
VGNVSTCSSLRRRPRAALRQNVDTELPSISFSVMSQMRVPQTPNERLAALYRQLALATSHHSIRDLRRAAERLAAARPGVATEARIFIDASRMKAAELKSPPAAEKRRNPQPTSGADTIKMHITPWVEDAHGIMGREVCAIDE